MSPINLLIEPTPVASLNEKELVTAQGIYEQLTRRFTEIGHLHSVQELLFWDSQIFMPGGGGASRAGQMSAIASLEHDRLNASDLRRDLEAINVSADALDQWQQANLREMRHLWLHASALDERLVHEIAQLSAHATAAWAQAKADNSYADFAPFLQKMIDLQKKKAETKAAVLGSTPYDALLDEHDPGSTSARIDTLFAKLETWLPAFVRSHADKQITPTPTPESVPQARQEELIGLVLDSIGYSGRVDVAKHPFALAYVPGDCRIAIRYDEHRPLTAVFAALHEAGHAFYEANLPPEYQYQPVGRARSASTHESQALGMEVQAGRSDEFLSFLFPLLRSVLDVSGTQWSDANLFAQLRRVAPSFIRVDADEITYPLHIILRYRIERAFIDGTLKARDLPSFWRAEMQRLLGIEPPNDSLGCLQDIQWAVGLFGYFPCYTLGAIKAAQFFGAAARELPELRASLAEGNFEPWRRWSQDSVHRWGALLKDGDLLKQATGADLDAELYKAHLIQRYPLEN